MTKRKSHYFPVPGTERVLTLWGDTDLLKEFFHGADETDFVPDEYVTMTVRPQTRRRYPEDPGFSVDAHERKAVIAANAFEPILPGMPFTCEVDVLVDGKNERKVRQFTFSGGPFRDLLALARARPAKDYYLRSPGGKAKAIALADGGQA